MKIADWIPTAFTLLGSVAGLVSFALLVYDRMVRGRPIVGFHRRAISGHGDATLRIINPSDDDLLITNITVKPGDLFGVALNDSAEGITRAVLRERLENLHLLPGHRALLPLIPFPTADPNREGVIRVYWQRSRMPWPWQPPVKIRASTAAIKRLEAARPVSRDEGGNKV